MRSTFDYIIIGGGSAGCVIAGRLSERPDLSVLLLEAGERERSVLLDMPLAFRLLRNMPRYDWGYFSQTEAAASNRSVPIPRGRLLGGSSSVNGMLYSRGHPRDYDRWAQFGARGWSFDEVLPFFKISEDNWRGASARHGKGGPLSVSRPQTIDPMTEVLFRTGRSLGYRVTDDFEQDVPDGFGTPDFTIRKGRRVSASTAFLDPARRRGNLSVVTSAQVTRVCFEGSRAVSVEYKVHGEPRSVRAKKEIALSAGTYGSPKVLMLSGIGCADHLQGVGVMPKVDLPAVGRNLQEHPLSPISFRARGPLAFGNLLRGDRLMLAVARWMLAGKGFPGDAPVSAIAYHTSREGLGEPDLESMFLPTGLGARVWFPGLISRRDDELTVLNVALRPKSRGFVGLSSPDPLTPPAIRFNLLSDPEDLALLRQSLKWSRRFSRQPPLSEIISDELSPGAAVIADSDLDHYLRQTVSIAQHPVGTCRMGDGPDTVVDSKLRVRGVAGLRVADASVMPSLIGGHTNAAAIMIGERCARFMLDTLRSTPADVPSA